MERARAPLLLAIGGCHARLCAADPADDWHGRLLRARRERPCDGCAAEQRDEVAPPHSITSSARRRMDVGNSMPIAFAVLRLITVSKFVTCSTGRSAGFAPRKTLAT